MLVSLLLATVLQTGQMLPGSPIHVAEDTAHGVVCYYIEWEWKWTIAHDMQPALSCVKVK